MGLYNRLTSQQKWPACGVQVNLKVQFKYGNVRSMRLYRLGERIEWGGIDVGKPGYKRVVVDAVAEECPNCGLNNWDYEVWLENDVMASALPASGNYDFARNNETFIVVEA